MLMLYTACRYNGASRGRIWDSTTNNYLSGFWNGGSGVAFHNAWLTGSGDVYGTAWIISVDQVRPAAGRLPDCMYCRHQ
jgi:hypothetical protein